MEIYKEIILDAITGKEIKIKFSPKELENFEKQASEANAQKLAKNQVLELKAEARSAAEAKLLALGLTVEDLKALLG